MKLKCQHCNIPLELDPAEDGSLDPFNCPGCGSLNEAPFQGVDPVSPPPQPRGPESRKPASKGKLLLIVLVALVPLGALIFYSVSKRATASQAVNRQKDEAFYREAERQLLAAQQMLDELRRNRESGAISEDRAKELEAKLLKSMEETKELRKQYERAPR